MNWPRNFLEKLYHFRLNQYLCHCFPKLEASGFTWEGWREWTSGAEIHSFRLLVTTLTISTRYCVSAWRFFQPGTSFLLQEYRTHTFMQDTGPTAQDNDWSFRTANPAYLGEELRLRRLFINSMNSMNSMDCHLITPVMSLMWIRKTKWSGGERSWTKW